MRFIRETFGDILGETVEKSSGCAILAVCLLPLACVSMVIEGRKEEKEKAQRAATAQTEMAQSCAKERAMTDHEALLQCQNAAALFGQDISANATRLSACVENRENTLAQCTAKGF